MFCRGLHCLLKGEIKQKNGKSVTGKLVRYSGLALMMALPFAAIAGMVFGMLTPSQQVAEVLPYLLLIDIVSILISLGAASCLSSKAKAESVEFVEEAVPAIN
jgi:hypothetical protein